MLTHRTYWGGGGVTESQPGTCREGLEGHRTTQAASEKGSALLCNRSETGTFVCTDPVIPLVYWTAWVYHLLACLKINTGREREKSGSVSTLPATGAEPMGGGDCGEQELEIFKETKAVLTESCSSGTQACVARSSDFFYSRDTENPGYYANLPVFKCVQILLLEVFFF